MGANQGALRRTGNRRIRALPLPHKKNGTMAPHRKIKSSKIVNDIWSGMSDLELSQKYGLSPEQLQRVYKQLIDSSLLSFPQIYEKPLTPRPPRTYVHGRLPIHDARDKSFLGLVRDISEKGLRIASPRADLPSATAFLFLKQPQLNPLPFRFEAACRWSKTRGSRSPYYVCGFEITHIADHAFNQLRELLAKLKSNGC